MNVAILSPDKPIFEGVAKVLTLPGMDGLFQVLDNHAPLVAALGAGVVKVDQENGEALTINITTGFIEVLNNTVSLLVSGVTE